MTKRPESFSKASVSSIPQVSELGFFRHLSFIKEVNFIYYWKIYDFMEFGVGLAWLGSLGLLLRRLMQEKIDKSNLSCFSYILNCNFFGKIYAGYIKSGLILAAGRQGLVLRFTELNKNAHLL